MSYIFIGGLPVIKNRRSQLAYSENGHSSTTIHEEYESESESKSADLEKLFKEELVDEPDLIASITQIAQQQRRGFVSQVVCLLEAGIKAYLDP